MDAKTKMLHLLEKSELMKHVVTVEPDVLTILLETASIVPSPDWTRWDAYSYLKRQCYGYIGWEARQDEIATSRHWEAFITFIDALLPDHDGYYADMQMEEIA